MALDAEDRKGLHSAFASYYERQLDGGTRPDAAVVVSLADLPGGPLARAELMVRRMHLRLSTGRGFFDLADIREAVRLSAAAPRSWQHALALARAVPCSHVAQRAGCRGSGHASACLGPATRGPPVSSHISNLLRKTGAANRLDLARLASAGAPVDAPVDAPR